MLPPGTPNTRKHYDGPPTGTTLLPPPITTTSGGLASKECKEPGWTDWINSAKPLDGNDIEYLPAIIKQQAFCFADQVAYIQCRQATTKTSFDLANDARTVCSTKAGFACYGSLQPDGKCDDYEFRVYCQCSVTSMYHVIIIIFIIFCP